MIPIDCAHAGYFCVPCVLCESQLQLIDYLPLFQFPFTRTSQSSSSSAGG